MLSLNLFIVVIVAIVAALAHLLSRGNFSITHDQQQQQQHQKTLTHKIEICFQLVKVLFIRIYWANKLWIIYWNNFMRMRNLWTQSKEFGFNVPLCNTYILIFFALTFLWMLIKLFLYCRRAAENVVPTKMNPVKSMTTSRLHTSTFRCSRFRSLSLSFRVFLSDRTIQSVVDF